MIPLWMSALTADDIIMIITEIKTTKKGRYALFCSDGFLFSIDEETFLSFEVRKGMELSEEDLTELKKHSDYRKALDKAFAFLSIRDHSEYELYSKLTRSFDPETSRQAADRVRELGYLDDRAFAERYAEELLRKGKSLGEIRQKFASKKIPPEIASEVLEAVETDEKPLIAELIRNKYMKKLAAENGRQKVYASLLRRGFRSRDIINALNDFGDTCDEFQEE